MAASTRGAGTRTKSFSSTVKDTLKTKCIFCDTAIDTNTLALQCDNCRNWVCLPCTKMPLTMYTELNKCEDNDLALDWSCRTCRTTKADLKGIQKTLLELKKDNDARLKHVEQGLSSLTTTMTETVIEEVNKVKDSISDSVTNSIAKKVNEIVETKMKEIENRKNRSSNLIIFKLPLCTEKDAILRKQYDERQLKILFNALCPDQEELQIKTCFRLFNKKSPSDSPPLKAVLISKDQRRNLLLQSKNIPNLDDSTLKNLIIVRDLTQEQRKEAKDLQSEKNRRVDNGETVTIRHGQVVEVAQGSGTRDGFRP